MAVSSERGIADQSAGDRVVGLEPLDFEKEQQITNPVERCSTRYSKFG
jgi:hypothetical protein